VPSASFDVLGPLVHPLPLFDTRIVGFESGSAITVVPADATHTEALLARGPLVVAIELSPGDHRARFMGRIVGPIADANPQATLTVFGPDGTEVTLRGGGCASIGPSSIAGFASECVFNSGDAALFETRVAGRHRILIEPGGAIDAPCAPGPTPDQSIALDFFIVR
jgi:hypothetical protein